MNKTKASTKAWVRMPLALLREQGLTKSGALVCTAIIDRATDQADALDWVEVSMQELMQDTSCAFCTVYRALLDIERLGLIEIRHAGKSGDRNAFRLTGCVELCPAACVSKSYATKPKPARASTRTRSRSKLSEDELNDYLTLSNRFKEA